MATNYLTTGVKVNVDATDFDVKFTKTAEALNQTLTKSQKALGLQYDANQRLVNSQGQVVDGLSQTQIKLGMYVDELGNVRTYQDGFAQGLSSAQQQLGFYADELGNVYNRLGQLVKASERAEREMAETAEHFSATRDAIGGLGSQFATVFSNLAGMGDEANKFALAMASIGEGFATTADVTQVLGELSKGLRGVSNVAESASEGVGAFGSVVGAMSGPGGWLTLGVGAVAGLTVGLATFLSETQESEDVVSELGISFEELRRRAKESGDEIKNVSDILANAGKAGLAGFGEQVESLKEIQRLMEYQSDLRAQMAEASARGGGAVISNSIKDAEEEIQAEINSLGQWLLQIEAGFVTEEEKLQEQLKVIDRLIELERERGATEARINEITETRKKVAQQLKDEQTREAQAAKDKADAETQRALEAQRKLEEEQRQRTRDSINFGGLEGAMKTAQQVNLTFSPETFAQDEAKLWDLVNQGIYESAEASAIISAAWERNAQAAQEAADAATKAAEEAKKRADAEREANERKTLQDWGYASLKAAAEKAVPEVVRLGELYAKINADAAATPGLQDEANVALNGVNASLATYYDKIAKAASSTGLDRKGQKALEEEEKKLKKALEKREVSEEYYNKAMKQLADARVRETRRVQQAERDEADKKKKAENDAAEREKASKQSERKREIDAYLESLKTPWEKYQDAIKRYDKEYKDGVIESREDLKTLKDKAWSEYQSSLPDPPDKTSEKPSLPGVNDFGKMMIDAMNRRDAGTASASAGSEKLYEMQIAQNNDRQAQMLASLDNTQVIVRDSFTMLNNLVLSIRENLVNDYNNNRQAVFRGLAAQMARNYGA